MADVNGDFAFVTVMHEKATDPKNLPAGASDGKFSRRSAPGESCMNRFSDAGSTPAVSSSEGREAKLGLFDIKFVKYPLPVGLR